MVLDRNAGSQTPSQKRRTRHQPGTSFVPSSSPKAIGELCVGWWEGVCSCTHAALDSSAHTLPGVQGLQASRQHGALRSQQLALPQDVRCLCYRCLHRRGGSVRTCASRFAPGRQIAPSGCARLGRHGRFTTIRLCAPQTDRRSSRCPWTRPKCGCSSKARPPHPSTSERRSPRPLGGMCAPTAALTRRAWRLYRRGLLGTCLAISKEEGAAALWKGLGPGARCAALCSALLERRPLVRRARPVVTPGSHPSARLPGPAAVCTPTNQTIPRKPENS